MSRDSAVQLRGWGWRHAGRSRWAVRGVDLDIATGERVLLLGPSGAGKSTLLLAVAGLLDPEGGEEEGDILVAGRPPELARDRTGLVMQDPESQVVMARAGDDVAFGLENFEVPRDAIWPRVDVALAAVGFPYGRDRATDRLSGGEQQRLVLAGTVALGPDILLLDEPTANLDPDGASLVRDALRRILSPSTTLVLVEHRVAEVLDLVDRVVVLAAGGGVVADGPPVEVFASRAGELADLGVWVPGVALPRRPPVSQRLATVAPVAPVGAAGEPVGAAGEPLLKAERVTYTFSGAARPAVSSIDLELRAAEAVSIVGPNGSGKSTLALMLAGLLAPTGGAVRRSMALGGPDRPLHKWPAVDLADRIGTVFQDPEHQFLTRTVADELALGPRRAGLSASAVQARVDDLLDRLLLTSLADANPFTLSGGEKRRLSVATALATEPAVVILDEPTFGQDRRTWLELLELISALRDEGTSICCVTHDLDFTAALSDRVVQLRDGALVSDTSMTAGGVPSAVDTTAEGGAPAAAGRRAGRDVTTPAGRRP